ncbi:MAG: V-type ATP synthase subunit A [Candidatus Thorarchaeota archaeon]|nr:V-type ATP synthase subunit A [Candidatus Thorarchaeota archaeon]
MTEKVGRIVSLAGPVVRCAGLPAVRMYEVVRVGHEQLIGEVIEVGDEEFTAQVYEETSGVAPGEPVVATGDALSVELGPGLIGSIYDGIQRPLPGLKELSGDFITRGLSLEGLDKEKKWEFNPTAKAGDKVESGDFIGEVPETGIITSKIMIPHNIEGEITEIASKGEYTVIETICKVKDVHGDIHEVMMMQRTPVRIGRPFKERVPLAVPLITGQRVIDTFMPQAKGGTGAIPGGFGTGKCVLGDTPILLEDGSLVTIQELYEEKAPEGILIEDNEEESLVQLKTPLRVLSFDGVGYSPHNATHIYKGTTKHLVRVTTRSGRHVTVTPIHKLFRFNGDTVEEVESRRLEVGDYLVVPRKITFQGDDIRFDAYEIHLDFRAVDEAAIDWMVDTIQVLMNKLSLKEIAHDLDVSYDVFIGFWKRKNRPTLRFLQKLANLARIPRVAVSLVKKGSSSSPFIIPDAMTHELAEWLGLFVADGHIKGAKGGIFLYNTSDQILDRFAELTKILFNLDASFGQDSHDRTPYAYVRNAGLQEYLYYLGIPGSKKTYNVRIPFSVMRSPISTAIHFLTGYFAGDGSFSRYTASFSTASKKLHIDLSYLLTRLGLLYRSRIKSGSGFLELDGINAVCLGDLFLEHGVFDYDKLRSLYDYQESASSHFIGTDLIPLSHTTLGVLSNLGLDSDGHDAFRKYEGIRLHNYTKLGEVPTVSTFQRIVDVVGKHVPNLDEELHDSLHTLLEMTDEVHFDPIKRIEQFEEETPVFDLTVEKAHNFIGGTHPFTLHNTVTLHQFAKWADAQVVVYVGCGERGNEMTEALEEWPHLNDPQSGSPLMERTVLIANTSNMPVAAREASIYVAVTLGEYFRDQGLDVALMADSTSRWAEALREISGRLGQLPSEEGYPAYLGSRLAQFYERGGRVKTLGSDDRTGSITICGAVSPPGGDFSEPVTQATLRIVKVFWALDKDLAARRFFPAINVLESYSLYHTTLEGYHKKELGDDWPTLVKESMALLQKDQELREIVQLVGPDALPESERATLEAARMIKEDFLTQSALHEIDTYSPIGKTYRMLRIIITFAKKMAEAVGLGVSVRRILEFSCLDNIARMKLAPWDSYGTSMDALEAKMEREFEALYKELSESGVITTST